MVLYLLNRQSHTVTFVPDTSATPVMTLAQRYRLRLMMLTTWLLVELSKDKIWHEDSYP